MYGHIAGFRRVAAAVVGAALLAAFAGAAMAQDETSATDDSTAGGLVGAASPKYDADRVNPAPIQVGHFRPSDARGLNVFEAPKEEMVPYHGFCIQWGAAFTQQFQDLVHSNTAAPNIGPGGVNLNQLIHIGAGFNNADANLYMNTQLARGIRVQLTSYLSSRHHNETWVKDGYLLIDGSPWAVKQLDDLMKYLTLRVGHFEVNYGDMHFRRTDGGEAMFNPLVGNLIMDAFTTEIGGEVYGRYQGLLGMVAVTGGEVRGTVLKPENRSPAFIGKAGFDRQFNKMMRVRLTGSYYNTHNASANQLYSGNRAGGRYYYVLENVNATETAQAWSGDLQPGFGHRDAAWVVNPFVKVQGLELFGNFEQAKGSGILETSDRKFTQNAFEGVFRFLNNQLYAAARYNTVKGRPAGAAFTQDVTITRFQAGGGWFLTPNLQAKGEYVNQEYKDYPLTDIHHGGKFHGAMFEAVVSF